MKPVSGYFSIKVIRHLSLMALLFAQVLVPVAAQTYFFEKYGVQEGLGSSKVFSIIQDRNDWIWIGTEGGLSRFDGSGFTNFTALDGIAGGTVSSLLQDSTGRIWIGHYNGGFSVYNNNKFSQVRIDSVDLTGDLTSIRQIGNHLWITSSKDGAIRIDFPQPSDTILTGKQYLGKDGISHEVSSSYVDSDNNLYCIIPAGGIKLYNQQDDNFINYSPEGLTEYFSVVSIFRDSKGDFWFGTYNGGLYRKVKATGEMKVYDVRDGLAKNFVSYITEDYRGNIWVGTWGGGISIFKDEKLRTYNRDNGLEALTVRCITEDNEKNMIIADYFTGISIYKGDHFTSITDPAIIQDKQVFSVDEDENGNIWIGTNAGVSVIDQSVRITKPVKLFNRETNLLTNVRSIKYDNNGSIWIGTSDRGLFRFDTGDNRMIFDPVLNDMLNSRTMSVTALEVDRSNRLWVGSFDRLLLVDRARQQIKTFTQADGLAGTSIKAIYCDKNNNVWIGSEEKIGLTRFEAATGNFKIIDIGEGLVPQAITQTGSSTIWIGTASGLLAIENDSVIMRLNENNGLLSNNIKLLQNQDDRFLYIGTNFGLNRLDLSDGTIASFTGRTGFTGIEASTNASMADSKGNLWFGTANGVTRLDPSVMPPVDSKPRIHISDLEVNYQPMDMVDGMKLSYKEKTLLFRYYTVSLTDPELAKFRIMLKGAENDWSPPTTQRSQNYPTLSPGHYTFRVIASNSYGYWNEEPLEYSFTIKPPFYLNPWFIALMVVLITAGVIAYIKVRERNLIREKKILEIKVAERTAEVVQKSMEIEEKNRDITASIRYAERIQRAMLPPEDSFHETFVLYMPKDIVSGDFYWMYDNGDQQFIAACDCTGHGVPGAFMSIIGHNSLNKIVREYGLTRPGAILDQLNSEVVKALMQRNEETINDGMDLTLIAFDRAKTKLEFAGAYNPLYLVRDGEVITYKGDRFPIGRSSLQEKKNFMNQDVEIRPGDMIYMCSDGYADQFGSTDSKKYKSGNVKKLLSEIYKLPVEEQRSILEKEILDWKGDLPQVDDIMFIGTRIPG